MGKGSISRAEAANDAMVNDGDRLIAAPRTFTLVFEVFVTCRMPDDGNRGKRWDCQRHYLLPFMLSSTTRLILAASISSSELPRRNTIARISADVNMKTTIRSRCQGFRML